MALGGGGTPAIALPATGMHLVKGSTQDERITQELREQIAVLAQEGQDFLPGKRA